MSLADLLSLGSRKEPAKEPAEDAKQKKRRDAWAQQQAAAAVQAKVNPEELDMLRDLVGKQVEEVGKEREEEQVAQKRELEDAVDMAAAMAKRRREDALKMHPEGQIRTAICKFYLMNQCDKGSGCPFAHGQENIMTPTNRPQVLTNLGPYELPPNAAFGVAALAQAVPAVIHYKKQMCRFFLVDACQKGSSCSYAHHVSELRSQVAGGDASNDWSTWGVAENASGYGEASDSSGGLGQGAWGAPEENHDSGKGGWTASPESAETYGGGSTGSWQSDKGADPWLQDQSGWGGKGSDASGWGGKGSDASTWGGKGCDASTWGRKGSDASSWGEKGSDSSGWSSKGQESDAAAWGGQNWSGKGSDAAAWGWGGKGTDYTAW